MFQVKGIAYLARESMVAAEFGRPAWEAFIQRFRKQEPSFPAQVLPISLIPGDLFLRLNDQLIRDVYAGADPAAIYWQAGVKSAQFAFANQLRDLFRPGDAGRFLAFTPRVYRNYFDSGELVATPETPTTWLVRMTGTPRHLYFELAVMGFASGALGVLQAPHPEPERLKQFSRGDDEVLYRFRTD
jgi:hypothetical protein